MEMCRLCLQQRSPTRRFSFRDLKTFFNIMNIVDHKGTDCKAWVCQFCWRRVMQCAQFVADVQSNELYMQSGGAVLIQNKNPHNYDISEITSLAICDKSVCQSNCQSVIFETEPTDVKVKVEIEVNLIDVKCEYSDSNSVDPVLSKPKKKIKKRAKKAPTDLQKAKVYGFVPVNLTLEQQKEEIENRKTTERYKNLKYKCEKCALSFFSEDIYEQHMTKHSETRGPYKCALCHYRFRTERVLRHHEVVTHARKWQCRSCGAVFSRKQWSVHACREAGQLYVCDVCGKKFEQKRRMQRHKFRSHESTQLYTCDHCGKNYKHKFQLRQHVGEHAGAKPHSCTKCSETFATSNKLIKHRHTVHKKEEADPSERYCVQCDKSFKSTVTYKSHLRSKTHLGEGDQKFKCNMCSKEFGFLSYLKDHVNTIHTKVERYPCEKCDKVFYNKYRLQKHLKNALAHRVEEKPRKYPCTLCDAAFKSTSTLKYHIEAIHEKLRPYVCEICNATFGYRAALYTHNKLKHENQKRVKKEKKLAVATTSYGDNLPASSVWCGQSEN